MRFPTFLPGGTLLEFLYSISDRRLFPAGGIVLHYCSFPFPVLFLSFTTEIFLSLAILNFPELSFYVLVLNPRYSQFSDRTPPAR
jgi:hypothetical protein